MVQYYSNPGAFRIGEWWHLIASWDLSLGKFQVYINDMVFNDWSVDILSNENILYTYGWVDIKPQTWGPVGGRPPTECVVDVSRLYMNFSESLDLGVVANRRKFIDDNGNQVSLGVDGSLPTGTAPILFFDGNGNAFAANKGTGGAFTLTGDLTDDA